jgi:threonine synthase
MNFYSTRDHSVTADFTEVIFTGLAPDGGLYHPTEVPDLHELFISIPPEMPFPEMSAEVTAALLPESFDISTARKVCARAFSFEPKLVRLSDQMAILELFHGPSCAFKDFGAAFLASAMQHFLGGRHNRAVILTATSGDTGSAVAQAFHGCDGIEVVLLYPSGRVSHLQEKQLTTVGDNVTALEVLGSFDDCQRMVKVAFTDADLAEKINLTSANSINLGRLLPQSFYYIYAFEQLRQTTASEIVFCVPSGNFGNLTAGILAWQWGLPVSGFIAATNVNDVVPEYLASGLFKPRESVATVANAMDVGNPSNFERMLEIFDADHLDMRTIVTGTAVTDEEILKTMAIHYERSGVFLDPHTAAGVWATERYLEGEGAQDAEIITFATAHPAKFNEIVMKACSVTPPLPARLADAMSREKHSVTIEPTSEALGAYLMENHASRE